MTGGNPIEGDNKKASSSEIDIATNASDVGGTYADDNNNVSAAFAKKLDFPLPKIFLSGFTQNIIAGLVCFCCPGMFNAMQGLGNAGGSDPAVAAAMNAALYGAFTVFGYFGGLLFNLLGNKLLMVIGGLTYCFYSISVYLWGQDESFGAMAITASAILGIGAGCLWTAQGAMTLSYSTEDKKGLFTAIFWIIFNLGGVTGGLITFFMNLGSEGAAGVNAATYFMFCGLMVLGAVVAFIFVVHPSRVVKADGQMVVFDKAASPKEEITSVLKLFTNKYMLLLTPLIIQSNWFYTYEFGGINGNLFDAESRGLNSAMYWGMQMIGAYLIGALFLDSPRMGRRSRAIYGLILISAFNLAQWGYAAWYQFSYGYDKGNQPEPLLNFQDGSEYWIPAALYMCMGIADSIVQTYAYWIMGAVANTPRVLSRYAGYYKGIQSFGACISWILEWQGMLYKWQMVICIALAVIFIPPTFIVATMVKDHGADDDDEEFKAGESTEEVLRA